MRIDFDDSKSEKLKKERGILDEAANLFLNYYITDRKAMTRSNSRRSDMSTVKLITLIFEYRLDAMDVEFRWLVTYWKATSKERFEYVQST